MRRGMRMRKLIPFAALAVLTAAIAASAATARTSATPIKVAVLSDCQGAFGTFDGQDLAGVVAAILQFAGGLLVSSGLLKLPFTTGIAYGDQIVVSTIGALLVLILARIIAR